MSFYGIRSGRQVAVIALLVACVLCLAGCGAAKGGSEPASSQSSAPSASESASAASSASSSSSSSSASARESVKIADVELGQDAIGRYFISATITNDAEEVLDVEIGAKASLTERETNKYDEEEEYTSVEKVGSSETVTPWVEGGSAISVLGLEAGESRELTVYPTNVGNARLSSTDYSLDKPELTVSKATPADQASKLSDVPDFGGDLKVEIISFDGEKVSGTVTNNTGKYLTKATLRFAKYDADGLPVTDKPWGDDRPIGADVVEESVKNLKPGASGEFNIRLGECDTVTLKDVHYDVDQNKKN